jgi:two-component system sensor histidine kinase PilS (NtrC family)
MTPLADADLLALNHAATVARLLTGAAHDINNALLVISGTAELLEDGTGPPAAVVRSMGRIRAQTAKTAAGLADLLAFARGDASARGRVNLRELVEGTVGLRSYAIGRAGLKADVSASPDRAWIVEGSRVRLQQAILNLVINAEQALAGSPGGTIQLELTGAGDRVAVRVADSGPGIAAGDRERIFEPFVTSKPREQSTGLGLPAARRIAELHGGSLALEDGAEGASFVLTLPAA